MSQPTSQVVTPGTSAYRKWLQLRTGASAKLWTIFAIAMIAVFVARIPWLFPNGLEIGQLPGEYYHFRIPLNKAFLWAHLACVLPAGLLAVFQFVPRIRARAMKFHRSAGQVINVLSLVATICAWGMARVSFGGDLATQSSVYLLGMMTTWSIIKSWSAIRRLQIDEHRTWIIRAWSYQALVITERLVMVFLVIYVSATGGYYSALSCEEVAHILNDQDLYTSGYPQCQPEWIGAGARMVLIEANPNEGTGLGLTAVTRLVFGPSMWIAIWIHAIATEYYLSHTQEESDRLRELSTKRQKARRVLQERKATHQ